VFVSSSGLGTAFLDHRSYTIHDPLALEKNEVHAVCLKATSFDKDENALSVSGLLVVETEPGIYRRVSRFSWDTHMHACKLSDELEEKSPRVHEYRDASGEECKEEGARGSREGGRTGLKILERLRGEPWTRRTMRLV
jgi:hypothetical protein